jgi:hypothetical protein
MPKLTAAKMIEDGYTAVIKKDSCGNDSIFFKKGQTKPIATGQFTTSGLLKLNTYALLTEKDHKNFGHLGSPSNACDTCDKTKRRKRNTPKT